MKISTWINITFKINSVLARVGLILWLKFEGEPGENGLSRPLRVVGASIGFRTRRLKNLMRSVSPWDQHKIEGVAARVATGDELFDPTNPNIRSPV